MKVRELIDLLSKVDPDTVVIYNAPFQGFREVTVVLRGVTEGLEHRYNFEKLNTVELLNGHGDYMASQGHDVVGYIPVVIDQRPRNPDLD